MPSSRPSGTAKIMVYTFTIIVAGIFSMNFVHTSWPTYSDSLTPQLPPIRDFCTKMKYCSISGLL